MQFLTIRNISISPINARPLDTNREFLWLATSVLLTLCFVNGFPIWAYLSQKLPLPLLVILPVVVAFVLIFGLIAWLVRAGLRPNLIWIVIAITLAGIALYLPDATIPSKRIHVAEYMLLAIIVRKAFSFRHAGVALLIWTVSMTALLGVHDEILQGLHVQRYYGLRDMVVNAFGAISGAALGHALHLFRPTSGDSNDSIITTLSMEDRLGISILFAGVILWVVLIQNYTGKAMPWWTILPLLSIIAVWTGIIHSTNNNFRTVNILCGFAAGTLIVPLMSSLFSLDFR